MPGNGSSGKSSGCVIVLRLPHSAGRERFDARPCVLIDGDALLQPLDFSPRPTAMAAAAVSVVLAGDDSPAQPVVQLPVTDAHQRADLNGRVQRVSFIVCT